jgi:hypothetical protein
MSESEKFDERGTVVCKVKGRVAVAAGKRLV